MPCRMRSFWTSRATLTHFGKVIRIGIDADEIAAAEFRQRAEGRRLDNFDVVAKPLPQRNLRVVGAA